MGDDRPLILFTNDDGIQSPGLRAAVEAFADIGDLLVVAPRVQQSGMGRSLPVTSEGRIHEQTMEVGGKTLKVYGVDGTPAQAVQHGVLELANRLPALCISGINYGDNCGNGVTISGTAGAAMEAASLSIPAIAMSQQTRHDQHLTYSKEVDFAAAAHFARQFGLWLMEHRAPDDVDLLKIDVPAGATTETAWRVTRISRNRVYWPTRPERVALTEIGRLGYALNTNPDEAEPDSDVRAVMKDGVVSVAPMSLDMTSRTDRFRLEQMFRGEASGEAADGKRNGRTREKVRRVTEGS